MPARAVVDEAPLRVRRPLRPRGRDDLRSRGILSFLALLASMVSLCIGTSYAKSLFPIVGAAGMTTLRIGISAAMMAAVLRPWRWRPTRAQARAVILYGIVLACMNLSFYQALRTLPLGVAIAIEFLGPLGVAVWYSRRPIDLAWVAMAAIGVVLLVAPGTGGRVDAVGTIYAAVAAVFWALYILTGKHASAVVPEGWIVCLGLGAASVIAIPVGAVAAGAVLLEPRVFASGAVIAVLCSALPYSLEIFALKRLPARVFGVVLSLEPAVGAVAAFAILGERIGTGQLAGMAAVIVASIGSTVAAKAAVEAAGTKAPPP